MQSNNNSSTVQPSILQPTTTNTTATAAPSQNNNGTSTIQPSISSNSTTNVNQNSASSAINTVNALFKAFISATTQDDEMTCISKLLAALIAPSLNLQNLSEKQVKWDLLCHFMESNQLHKNLYPADIDGKYTKNAGKLHYAAYKDGKEIIFNNADSVKHVLSSSKKELICVKHSFIDENDEMVPDLDIKTLFFDSSRVAEVSGDLHGYKCPEALIMQVSSAMSKGQRLLFTGDYFDRGPYSLESLIILLAFQYKYRGQGRIILLRGNHEFSGTNRFNGKDWLPPQSNNNYYKFTTILYHFFSELPGCAVTFADNNSGTIFTHGAISDQSFLNSRVEKYGDNPLLMVTGGGICLPTDCRDFYRQVGIRKSFPQNQSCIAEEAHDSIFWNENGGRIKQSRPYTTFRGAGVIAGNGAPEYLLKLGFKNHVSGHIHNSINIVDQGITYMTFTIFADDERGDKRALGYLSPKDGSMKMVEIDKDVYAAMSGKGNPDQMAKLNAFYAALPTNTANANSNASNNTTTSNNTLNNNATSITANAVPSSTKQTPAPKATRQVNPPNSNLARPYRPGVASFRAIISSYIAQIHEPLNSCQEERNPASKNLTIPSIANYVKKMNSSVLEFVKQGLNNIAKTLTDEEDVPSFFKKTSDLIALAIQHGAEETAKLCLAEIHSDNADDLFVYKLAFTVLIVNPPTSFQEWIQRFFDMIGKDWRKSPLFNFEYSIAKQLNANCKHGLEVAEAVIKQQQSILKQARAEGLIPQTTTKSSTISSSTPADAATSTVAVIASTIPQITATTRSTAPAAPQQTILQNTTAIAIATPLPAATPASLLASTSTPLTTITPGPFIAKTTAPLPATTPATLPTITSAPVTAVLPEKTPATIATIATPLSTRSNFGTTPPTTATIFSDNQFKQNILLQIKMLSDRYSELWAQEEKLLKETVNLPFLAYRPHVYVHYIQSKFLKLLYDRVSAATCADLPALTDIMKETINFEKQRATEEMKTYGIKTTPEYWEEVIRGEKTASSQLHPIDHLSRFKTFIPTLNTFYENLAISLGKYNVDNIIVHEDFCNICFRNKSTMNLEYDNPSQQPFADLRNEIFSFLREHGKASNKMPECKKLLVAIDVEIIMQTVKTPTLFHTCMDLIDEFYLLIKRAATTSRPNLYTAFLSRLLPYRGFREASMLIEVADKPSNISTQSPNPSLNNVVSTIYQLWETLLKSGCSQAINAFIKCVTELTESSSPTSPDNLPFKITPAVMDALKSAQTYPPTLNKDFTYTVRMLLSRLHIDCRFANFDDCRKLFIFSNKLNATNMADIEIRNNDNIEPLWKKLPNVQRLHEKYTYAQKEISELMRIFSKKYLDAESRETDGQNHHNSAYSASHMFHARAQFIQEALNNGSLCNSKKQINSKSRALAISICERDQKQHDTQSIEKWTNIITGENDHNSLIYHLVTNLNNFAENSIDIDRLIQQLTNLAMIDVNQERIETTQLKTLLAPFSNSSSSSYMNQQFAESSISQGLFRNGSNIEQTNTSTVQKIKPAISASTATPTASIAVTTPVVNHPVPVLASISMSMPTLVASAPITPAPAPAPAPAPIKIVPSVLSSSSSTSSSSSSPSSTNNNAAAYATANPALPQQMPKIAAQIPQTAVPQYPYIPFRFEYNIPTTPAPIDQNTAIPTLPTNTQTHTKQTVVGSTYQNMPPIMTSFASRGTPAAIAPRAAHFSPQKTLEQELQELEITLELNKIPITADELNTLKKLESDMQLVAKKSDYQMIFKLKMLKMLGFSLADNEIQVLIKKVKQTTNVDPDLSDDDEFHMDSITSMIPRFPVLFGGKTCDALSLIDLLITTEGKTFSNPLQDQKTSQLEKSEFLHLVQSNLDERNDIIKKLNRKLGKPNSSSSENANSHVCATIL